MWNKIKPFLDFCGIVTLFWGGYGKIFGEEGMIYQDWNITYEFVYSGMLAIGTVTIIYLLIALIPRVYRRIKSLKVEPDTDINSALHYIVKDSIFGKGLNYNQGGFKDASNALKEYIEKKKIAVFGIHEDSSVHQKIEMISEYELKIFFTDYRDTDVCSFITEKDESDTDDVPTFIIKEKPQNTYTHIYISEKQLKKYFPPRWSY